MNDKSNRKEKDIILTRIIDEFLERERAGENPTIDEYIKKYPEHADELKEELTEEQFWLSTFNRIKQFLKITPSEKEIQKGWEWILEKITSEPKIEHIEPRDTTIVPKKIILLWDQLQDKITQLTPKITEGIIPKMPEFQSARNYRDTSHTFPYTTIIESNRGKILLEINHTGKQDYLTLKTFFHFAPKKDITNIWGSLYKSNKYLSSVDLKDNGEAFFPLIKKGEYILKFFEEKELLEEIEISIITNKK